MAKTESKNGFFDVAKAFGDFRVPGIDVDAIVAAQRKNFEALTQVNQFAVEGLRTVAKRQAEIAQQTIEEASAIGRSRAHLRSVWRAPSRLQSRRSRRVWLMFAS